jgi:nucleotidyltransferase substrate binding protein (TIGR01987 family)
VELSQKYTELFTSLGKAIGDFEISVGANLTKYNEQEIDWIKNAQIQKFEFCIELLWKTAKVYLESIEEKLFTPKLTIKSLFLQQIIDEDLYLKLMNCLNDRNALSHIYKFELFDEIHKELENHLSAIKQTYSILGKIKF